MTAPHPWRAVGLALCFSFFCAGPLLTAEPDDHDRDGDRHSRQRDCDDHECDGDETGDHGGQDEPGGGTGGGGGDEGAGGGGGGTSASHAGLTWNGPGTCQACHQEEALEMHGTVHYQWQGDAVYMASGPARQGKHAGGVNSYCINILGNWNGCSTCHVGLGAEPEPAATPAQLDNIDCLVCHQKEYKRIRVDGVMVPDTAHMTVSMDEAVRTVHRPERANCLQCHAKAGGGDAVKRGDLALATAHTADSSYDVHMATSGADLRCQSCHLYQDHHVMGKGSDLRPSDRVEELNCSNARCHSDKSTSHGHSSDTVNRHVDRLACQTCHIPRYARNAADTAADEATELHRTWVASHPTASGALHPDSVKGNDVLPRYRFWDRTSTSYNLFETAHLDPATGRYATSRPNGAIDDPDSKLYPFKYKTAEQPFAPDQGVLVALDTSVFFATGDGAAATEQGLVNMGYSASEPWVWVETDTFQLLNHQVSPREAALRCADCHGGAQMDLRGELGYGLKGSQAAVCSQCHRQRRSEGFAETHEEHVREKRFDCSWCHTFSRPERGLRRP